jgi:hypothetical protein
MTEYEMPAVAQINIDEIVLRQVECDSNRLVIIARIAVCLRRGGGYFGRCAGRSCISCHIGRRWCICRAVNAEKYDRSYYNESQNDNPKAFIVSIHLFVIRFIRISGIIFHCSERLKDKQGCGYESHVFEKSDFLRRTHGRIGLIPEIMHEYRRWHKE